MKQRQSRSVLDIVMLASCSLLFYSIITCILLLQNPGNTELPKQLLVSLIVVAIGMVIALYRWWQYKIRK